MHGFAAVLLLATVLMGLSLPVWADPVPAPAPPAVDLPFDDDSEARQAEVERQVLGFLQTLHTHWGQSQDTLRNAVTGTIERDERGELVYTRTFAEHGVLEGYNFRDGRLVRGVCLFLQQPVNDLNEFIVYYEAVKHALTASYGIPAQDQTVWENDLYQSLPDYWGLAVQIGHLRYAARWETSEGTLSIELTGNPHSRLMIEYRSNQAARLT
jgi:hypothetical protein